MQVRLKKKKHFSFICLFVLHTDFLTRDFGHVTFNNVSQRRVCQSQVTLALSSLLLAAVAVSAFPQSPESKAAIVSQETEVNYDGTFKNKYETTSVFLFLQVHYVCISTIRNVNRTQIDSCIYV